MAFGTGTEGKGKAASSSSSSSPSSSFSTRGAYVEAEDDVVHGQSSPIASVFPLSRLSDDGAVSEGAEIDSIVGDYDSRLAAFEGQFYRDYCNGLFSSLCQLDAVARVVASGKVQLTMAARQKALSYLTAVLTGGGGVFAPGMGLVQKAADDVVGHVVGGQRLPRYQQVSGIVSNPFHFYLFAQALADCVLIYFKPGWIVQFKSGEDAKQHGEAAAKFLGEAIKTNRLQFAEEDTLARRLEKSIDYLASRGEKVLKKIGLRYAQPSDDLILDGDVMLTIARAQVLGLPITYFFYDLEGIDRRLVGLESKFEIALREGQQSSREREHNYLQSLQTEFDVIKQSIDKYKQGERIKLVFAASGSKLKNVSIEGSSMIKTEQHFVIPENEQQENAQLRMAKAMAPKNVDATFAEKEAEIDGLTVKDSSMLRSIVRFTERAIAGKHNPSAAPSTGNTPDQRESTRYEKQKEGDAAITDISLKELIKASITLTEQVYSVSVKIERTKENADSVAAVLFREKRDVLKLLDRLKKLKGGNGESERKSVVQNLMAKVKERIALTNQKYDSRIEASGDDVDCMLKLEEEQREQVEEFKKLKKQYKVLQKEPEQQQTKDVHPSTVPHQQEEIAKPQKNTPVSSALTIEGVRRELQEMDAIYSKGASENWKIFVDYYLVNEEQDVQERARKSLEIISKEIQKEGTSLQTIVASAWENIYKNNPAFSIQGMGFNPLDYDLDAALKASAALSEKQIGSAVSFPESVGRFKTQNVNGDGGCLFYAVADQLLFLGHPRLLTEQQQRGDFNPASWLRGLANRPRGWGNDADICQLARELNVVIALIYTREEPSNDGGGYTVRDGFRCFYIDENDHAIAAPPECLSINYPKDRPLIRIGQTGSHFISIYENPALSAGAIREALTMENLALRAGVAETDMMDVDVTEEERQLSPSRSPSSLVGSRGFSQPSLNISQQSQLERKESTENAVEDKTFAKK